MGLLQQLGLGLSGVFDRSVSSADWQQIQRNHINSHMAYLQQQNAASRCIHSDCFICSIDKRNTLVKKLLYEQRCKDYMKKFRRKSKCQKKQVPNSPIK